MAVATAIVTQSAFPDGSDFTQNRQIIYGVLAIQASSATYQTGGLAVTFANPDNILATQGPYANRCDFQSRGGSGYLYYWTTKNLWIASTSYVVGQSLVVTSGNKIYTFTCTTLGTSGTPNQPAWNFATNSTTTDGTVVWTCEGLSSGLVQVFQSNSSATVLAEITGNSAVPAGVSGDTISCKAEFVRSRA